MINWWRLQGDHEAPVHLGAWAEIAGMPQQAGSQTVENTAWSPTKRMRTSVMAECLGVWCDRVSVWMNP